MNTADTYKWVSFTPTPVTPYGAEAQSYKYRTPLLETPPPISLPHSLSMQWISFFTVLKGPVNHWVTYWYEILFIWNCYCFSKSQRKNTKEQIKQEKLQQVFMKYGWSGKSDPGLINHS